MFSNPKYQGLKIALGMSLYGEYYTVKNLKQFEIALELHLWMTFLSSLKHPDFWGWLCKCWHTPFVLSIVPILPSFSALAFSVGDRIVRSQAPALIQDYVAHIFPVTELIFILGLNGSHSHWNKDIACGPCTAHSWRGYLSPNFLVQMFRNMLLLLAVCR